MKHEYLISYCFKGGSEGKACLFRTTDKKAWFNKIKEVKKNYCIQSKYCRTIVYDERTIFSFAGSLGIYNWSDFSPLTRPIQIKYGIPKEASDEERIYSR